jgi:hypothetical protein
MITKKGVFYLICLSGYFFIIFKGIPVFYDNSIHHISLFASGNSTDIYHGFIDYKKLTVYLVMWPVFVFTLYKIVDEIKFKK